MKTDPLQFTLAPYAKPRRPTQRFILLSWFAAILLLCIPFGFFYALTTPYLLVQFASPIVIMFAVFIWALPDMDRAPTQIMTNLFFAYSAAAMLWPNYIALDLPGLPWITMIRLVGFPCALALLICVSVSPPFRADLKKSMDSIPWLAPILTSFFIIQFISIAFSNEKGSSINTYIDAQIGLTTMFFASAFIFLKPHRVERWAMLMWVSAMVLAVFGIWEGRLEHTPWAGNIPSFLQVGDEYIEKVLGGARRLGTNEYRLQSTHSTSLGFAEYMALTLPFVIHFMIGPYPKATRILAGVSIPIIFFIIVGTGARLGSIGFVLACVLYLVSWSFLQWRTVKSSIFGPALVFGAPVLAVFILLSTLMIGRIRLIIWGGANTSYSTQGRFDQYAEGIPKVLSHPWGYGIGTGAGILNYRNLGDVLTIDTYYLLVALDYGILGFILYYGALLLSATHAVKVSHFEKVEERELTMLIPVAISLIVFIVVKSVFSQTENHFIPFILMGMACALIYRIRNKQETSATAVKAQ